MDNLLERLGFTPKARSALVEEGLDSLESLELFTEKEVVGIITQLVKTKSTRKAAERIIIRALHMKRLLAVKEILRKSKLCATILDENEIDASRADEEAVRISKISKENLQDDEAYVKPPKFTGNNWFFFKK